MINTETPIDKDEKEETEKEETEKEETEKEETEKEETEKEETEKEETEKEETEKEETEKEKAKSSYPLLMSILTNLGFYVATFWCLIFIAYYSSSGIISTIITFILTSLIGYFSHYNSHHFNFVEFYTQLDNYITRNSVLNHICLNVCYFLDFHEITHHNSDINKIPLNLFYEFILNFVTQGGFLMILIYIARSMNLYVCLLWGLLYATVHIINYSLYPSLTHNYHHFDKYTNYGIDIWDILFGTKNENTPVENINHYGINLIILTALIIKLFCV
jgi:hypothetical protein